MNTIPSTLTVAERSLISQGTRPGQPTTLHLEEVRDTLAKIHEKQAPEDIERSLDQLHVSFENGVMTARLLTPQGPSEKVYRVSQHGASLLAREVLPAGFWAGLRTQAGGDIAGQRLATLNWAYFARQGDRKPRMIRTINTGLNKQVVPLIRSCHSQGYAPYSNLEFVQDILDNGGEFANMPVLDFKLSDSYFRLRIADSPSGELPLHQPVPMFELWNSEVGLRRVGLRGGLFKLVCTNGAGHWDDKTEYNWIHRGSADRIKSGVRSAFENVRVASSGVLDAYNRALDVGIDNAYQWLEESLLGAGVSAARTEEIKVALTHETTTPGLNLASCIDAVTLIAQQDDLAGQYELERIASSLLHRGLNSALQHGGRIPVLA